MYFVLPETEDRTLEDIELHFSDNSKKITDRKIRKSPKLKANDVENATDPAKKVTAISDIVEMNNRQPSMMGVVNNGMAMNDDDGRPAVLQRDIAGCDNRAFANDR